MLEYSSNRHGKWRRVDVDEVRLADGRRAKDLSQWELFRELEKIECPYISDGMPKVDMLFALGVHQQELLEAKDRELAPRTTGILSVNQ